jgi:starch synthase (maltosyl-transferring)
VIPNGIELARDAPAEPADLEPLGVPPGRRVILFVGRLDTQKGVDWLLQRLPATLAELPSHDLLVVGSGPQRRQLAKRAQSLGIRQRVHFAGWCGNVENLLQASDLLVLPSRWEGMPNVVLEAMAGGLPVVATHVEGVGELLGEDHGGQLVAPGDAAAFARQIVQFCHDRRVAVQIGERNRRIAAEQFSLQRMIDRYQDLYLAHLRH